MPLGASPAAAALPLLASAVATFRAAGTPVPARRPTTTIAPAGLRRFSRHPIYLAFSLLQAGIAVWRDSLWLLAATTCPTG